MSDEKQGTGEMSPEETKRRALLARLEAAELSRAAKRAALAAARETTELEEKIKLLELEDEHGTVGIDIAAVFCPATGRMAVVKRPRSMVYDKFQARANRSAGASESDICDFVRACLVYPDKKTFEEMCERVPNMRGLAAQAAAELGTAQAGEQQGK